MLSRRDMARRLLDKLSSRIAFLQQRVEKAERVDSYLRCAKPVHEPLDTKLPNPDQPKSASILAADGSQIFPDRHAPVNFYLINIGLIEMDLGSGNRPVTATHTEMHNIDELSRQNITSTKDIVALERDILEREKLAEAAAAVDKSSPIITLTDGPLELWMGKGQHGSSAKQFQTGLRKYQLILKELNKGEASTAGYVDKPRANLVIGLLEAATLAESDLEQIRNLHPLQGVTDIFLFSTLLEPGERSAVFAIQSKSATNYTHELKLHFFYLNVGTKTNPWIARVEIPAWVSKQEKLLNDLHAIILNQCSLMGTRNFPYIIHRAHEIALVTQEEKKQIQEMFIKELYKHDLNVGAESQKQALKTLTGRRRFSH